MKELIYAVDDEKSILDLYDASFAMAGFACDTFLSAKEFFVALAKKKPDLILLDIMMPEEDGLSVLSRLQNSPDTQGIPVILISAKGSETDKVLGLNSGAADYLAKPFGVLELIARVKANLRKSSVRPKESYLDLTIDETLHCVRLSDEPLVLSEKEYQLLCYFIHHSGIVLSKDQLMSDIWGFEVAVETRTLDMFVSKLRKKIESSAAHIETIRGVGFILK